ncbi:MAG: FlgD immunoglobulin-like domain containing protein, partial [Candidatus Poribacteria bacterium]
PTRWTPIAQGVAAAVTDGRLATWDTGVTEGPARLRLVVDDAAGHRSVAERSIVVAGASPADRHAILSATDDGVRLRLPPNALPASAFVTVNDVSAESVMGRVPLRVVRIDPDGIALDPRKPGTLEFRLPAAYASAAVGVAEWDSAADAWRYLGGSVDTAGGWVRTRVFRLGRYALIPEPASLSMADTELRLRCQPRAFSPLGGELPQEAFVTFSLREAAHVRIRIYNQAGRLARRLPEAQAGSGEHSVPWDGRDDMGRALPNGAYVVQVDAGYAQERQVVLIWNR